MSIISIKPATAPDREESESLVLSELAIAMFDIYLAQKERQQHATKDMDLSAVGPD